MYSGLNFQGVVSAYAEDDQHHPCLTLKGKRTNRKGKGNDLRAWALGPEAGGRATMMARWGAPGTVRSKNRASEGNGTRIHRWSGGEHTE